VKGKRSKVWYETGVPTKTGKTSADKMLQMQREAKAQRLKTYLLQQNKRLQSGFVGQRHVGREVEYKAWLIRDIARHEKFIASLI